MTAPIFLTQRITNRLFEQVDASSMVFFRVAFGVIMLVEVWRFWSHNWIERYYIAPDFLFKYYGFEWVEAWPGTGMYWHFGLLAALSLMIAVGALYRLAAILFFFAFSYVFLLEQARYLNHFYLVILLAFLLIFLPANRSFSIDALFQRKIKSDTVPVWSVWLFRTQLEIILLYAGIVKINPDWLRLEPLGMWLSRRDDWALIGPLFNQDWVVGVAAYGAILLHVVGAPLLLCKRTRIPVMIMYFAFHLMNHFLFNIGIFPWITMAAMLIFLDPDWPKRVIHWIYRWVARLQLLRSRVQDVRKHELNEEIAAKSVVPIPSRIVSLSLLSFITIWLSIQILFPLRHFLYPGSPSWTEEGHRFSWQMKLRDKKATAVFIVNDPNTGNVWTVRPEDLLMQHQARKVADRPDMILQLAHYLAELMESEIKIKGVKVHARVCASLNGRRAQLLIDPNRDLAKVERALRHADWIIPLTQPFERPPERKRRVDLSC